MNVDEQALRAELLRAGIELPERLWPEALLHLSDLRFLVSQLDAAFCIDETVGDEGCGSIDRP